MTRASNEEEAAFALAGIQEVERRIMRFRTLLQTRGLIATRKLDILSQALSKSPYPGDLETLGYSKGEIMATSVLAKDFQDLFPFEDGKGVPVDQEMLDQAREALP